MSPITGARKELVWRNGVNETDLGPMIWNDRARKSTMGIYQKRGNPVLLDVNHNYNEELRAGWEARGEAAPTAGNGYLELDAQGNLWLVPDWSNYARAKIDGKELRFLSPDFAHDKKTNEILEIFRISLVAEPGTWRARMVANATRRKGRLTMGVSAELIAAIQEMATLMAAEKVSDACQQAVNKVIALASGGDSAPAEEPMTDMNAADMPTGDMKKPDTMVQKYTLQARKTAEETATLAARRLRAEKDAVLSQTREQARKTHNTTPAEEAELLKITEPSELDRAVALLAASRQKKDDKIPATLGREPLREAPDAQGKQPTSNPYLDALNRHGLAVAGQGGAS